MRNLSLGKDTTGRSRCHCYGQPNCGCAVMVLSLWI